jgi:hypothetical protein
MNKAFLGACLLATLAGCATPYTWYRAGTTSAQYQADMQSCNHQTVKFAGGYDSSTPSGIGQGMETNMRKTEMSSSCMRDRGYTQRPLSEDNK